MNTTITVGVYRRLDNRFEGLADDSPRAVELHNRRKLALHQIFDRAEGVEVRAWGDTDDAKPHEYVELVLVFLGSKALEYAVVPGLKWLGGKLTEKAIDTVLEESLKWLVSKFRSKQEKKEILDFTITLPDGTSIAIDPPDRNATIQVHFSDGSVSSVVYSSNSTDKKGLTRSLETNSR